MALVKIDLCSAIADMVELVLPRFSPENIFVHTSLRFKELGKPSGHGATRDAQILFHRPGSSVRVLWLEDEDFQGHPRWKVVANDTSTWVPELGNHIDCLAQEVSSNVHDNVSTRFGKRPHLIEVKDFSYERTSLTGYGFYRISWN